MQWYRRWFDVGTLALNTRDVGRTVKGYTEAKRLLKEQRPDVLLIKGGFVGVPMGRAAASLGIPYITHDSDSVPGLANRLISKQAKLHATGMPAELYSYPKDRTVFTGIPVSEKFKKVSPELRDSFRKALGLEGCTQVVTIVGGSQGADQLNRDIISIAGRLMERFDTLGIVHVAGKAHEDGVRRAYDKELLADEARRVVVKGFTSDIDACQGAADVVVSRAGATQVAELALQALPVIVVPGQLAGGHQQKNADYLVSTGSALQVSFGDAEQLLQELSTLLTDPAARKQLSDNLHKLAKPDAAKELAALTIKDL